MSRDELLSRVDDLERRLRGLEGELREIRALARATRVAAPEPEPWEEAVVPPAPATPPPPAEWWQDERGRWHEGPRPKPADEPVTTPAAREFDWSREVKLPELSLDDLFGAKALAWAGGIVTLLGVVFFFVLAVNRGWIGPVTRVGLGAGASLAVFVAGLWLERRYGALYSALAAVGAGIAGGYATLLAATALYDLLPTWGALFAAAAIAGVGLAVSLRWSSEIVAGIGLVGAMAVPAFLVLQGGLTTTGTAFVALVFAAAAVVAAEQQWPTLLVVSVVVGLAQVGALVLDTDGLRWSRFAVATVFWALYAAAGLTWQLRVAGERLARLAASLLLLSAGFAILAAAWMLDGSWGRLDREGSVLGIAALAYGAVSAVFFRRPGTRQLSVLLGATGLTVGAIAVADLLSGASLTYAWAAEAALLAWLAWRLGELRYQLVSFAYLALALGHALVFEARPDLLFDANDHPGRGVPTTLALAAAVLLAAWFAREPATEPEPEEGVLSFLTGPLVRLRGEQQLVRRALAGFAGLPGVYALSLGILALFELGSGDVETLFDRGHVAVSATWGLIGLAVVAVGLRRAVPAAAVAGLAWLVVTLVKLGLFDAQELDENLRSYSFLAVGGCVLLAGYLFELARRADAPLGPVAVVGSIVPLGLALSANSALVTGHYAGIDLQGLALLGLAVPYLGLGAGAFGRQRDFSTLLWGLGLAVVAAAEAILVSGDWLTLAWGATAAATVGLAVLIDERRLQVASLAYLALAFGWTIGEQAPPTALLRSSVHPASGIASAAILVAALAVFSRLCLFEDARWRSWSAWAAGIVAVYGLSLAILELAEQVAPGGDVKTNFQRGHTAVSAFWGLLGLALLYVGLTRRMRVLRLGGFALFGVSLAKLFLYDLAFLNSVARALSFLAVGAVLLLGGFFYQRLSAQLEGRQA